MKTIDKSESELCDMPISAEEVIKAINHLKNNKSPGTDGLTREFYKLFADDLAPFLLKMFNESIINQCLPPTLTQGLITLIPKPKKKTYFFLIIGVQLVYSIMIIKYLP